MRLAFNPLEGRFFDDEQAALQAAVIERARKELQDLEETFKTPGWKFIEGAIKADLEQHKAQLLNTQTMEETLRKQEYIKAREQFLSFIYSKLEEAKCLLEEEQEVQRELNLFSGQAPSAKQG